MTEMSLPERLLAAYRAKRNVDGLNGRTWDAVRHAEAEAEIERLERPPLPGPCDAPKPESHAALFAQQSSTNRADRATPVGYNPPVSSYDNDSLAGMLSVFAEDHPVERIRDAMREAAIRLRLPNCSP